MIEQFYLYLLTLINKKYNLNLQIKKIDTSLIKKIEKKLNMQSKNIDEKIVIINFFFRQLAHI